MKIIFMGTPDFAVPSLDILIKAGYEISAVVTSPDKYGGRGRKTLIESAVKKYAAANALKIFQPKNLKSEEFNEEIKKLNADLQIVVAFRMLPEKIWNMPPLGTYNLHGSLLPKYRGAAPINWAVINGEKITGVTFFKLKHEIDTGSILIKNEMPILEDENASQVHDKMMILGAETVLKAVNMIASGEYNLTSQDDSSATHAPKLTRENTKIDFDNNALTVYNFIRGLSLFPGAWFEFNKQEVKTFSCRREHESHEYEIGKILSDGKNYIKIAVRDGFIELLDIQYPGKKKMPTKDFLNGFDWKVVNN